MCVCEILVVKIGVGVTTCLWECVNTSVRPVSVCVCLYLRSHTWYPYIVILERAPATILHLWLPLPTPRPFPDLGQPCLRLGQPWRRAETVLLRAAHNLPPPWGHPNIKV